MRIPYKPDIEIKKFKYSWAWFLHASNGKILASRTHFSTKDSCLKSLNRAKKLMIKDLPLRFTKEKKPSWQSLHIKKIGPFCFKFHIWKCS